MSNSLKYGKWQNFIDKKRIKEINDCVEKNYSSLEKPEDGATGIGGVQLKFLTTKIIEYGYVQHLLHGIVDKLHFTAGTEFGYQTYPSSYSEYINLNIYNDDRKARYDWHTDTSQSDLFDIKLTALINISLKPYEGGKFQFFQNEIIPVDELDSPGDMILFKSYVNHRVLPVTSGERRTLSIWLRGPKFQ